MDTTKPEISPGDSQTDPVVREDVTTPESEEQAKVDESANQAPATSDQLEKQVVNYSRLREEIKKRKALEAELQSLKSSAALSEDTDDESDDTEPDTLKSEVSTLKSELKELREERELTKALHKFPALSSKLEDFAQYREEHPEYPVDTAAKLFIVDRDLYQPSPERKGLEKPTSGPKAPATGGYTPDQVKQIRESDPRLYTRLIRAGKFKDVKW